jgi:hypothetical protein
MLLLAFVDAASAQSLPFLPPGDIRLRDAVQRLADEGSLPLATKWPIPTLDVPASIRDQFRAERLPGSATDAGWEVSVGANPAPFRSFSDTPRDNGQIGVQAGWAAGDYAGGAFRVGVSIDPQDGQRIRLDGTYAAARVGNWLLSAGWHERWWGPAWDGSLILSSNARPLPSLSIDRARSLPPESKFLRWIGPYSWSTFMGRFESGRADFDNPLLWGLRLNVRPFGGPMELGFTRTAQWCRPGFCDLKAFRNVVLARDNVNENVGAAEEPGNQLAGLDFRWSFASRTALYYQLNGESIDNRNWRPRLTTHIIGLEAWSRSAWMGGWRMFAEFADTTCGGVDVGTDRRDFYGCSYENSLFRGGYRYRGRPIGHPLDGDGRMYSVGGFRIDAQDRTWEVRLRRGAVTRGGASTTNTVSAVRANFWNAELRIDGRFKSDGMLRGLRYDFGVGADRFAPRTGATVTRGRAFLNVTRGW